MARRITPSGLMQITRNSTNKIRLTMAVIVVPGMRVSYSVLIFGVLAFLQPLFALPPLRKLFFSLQQEMFLPVASSSFVPLNNNLLMPSGSE